MWHLTPLAFTPSFSHSERSVFLANKLIFFCCADLSIPIGHFPFFFSFSSQKTWQTKAISAIEAPTGEKPLNGAAERRIIYLARCK